MVKRQTVWLSTMMVLSLMLIGYYTMNNQSTSTTAATGNDVSTSITTSAGTSNQASSGSGQDNSTTTSTNTSNPTGSDWYVSMQTSQDQQMAQKIETDQAVLANNNASSDQLAKAQQDLTALRNEQGQLANAKDMILGHGYQDCVIVPNKDNSKVIVYVKASKLSNSQAVEIMNIVSQQLNMSAADVVVQVKA